MSMRPLLLRLPLVLTLIALTTMLVHGPIAQLPHYHDFADARAWFGLKNGDDVLSNLGFALVGLWGLLRLAPLRHEPALAAGWAGYRLFLIALVLTALGSGWYHLAPSDARLVWDRLPIALACAGLLAAVRAETRPGTDARRDVALLALLAVLSVAWWRATDLLGQGDLRPYLLLQFLPLALIPLWQALHGAPRADRMAFGAALGLYALAKLAELNDHQVLDALGLISGHTIKHLLATAGAAVLTMRLARRVATAAAAFCVASNPR